MGRREVAFPSGGNQRESIMADTEITVENNTPEMVAYRLMETIAYGEGVKIRSAFGGRTAASRDWVLDTYCQCLDAVKNPHMRAGNSETSE